MQLDFVHDLQQTYRAMVRTMAFPGTTVDLSPTATRIEPVPPVNAVLMLLSMVLVDSEVSFTIDSANSGSDGRIISEVTGGRMRPPAEAAFLFVTNDAVNPIETIRAASVGTLVDPHLGATILCEVDYLTDPSGGGTTFDRDSITLSGPGIESTRRLVGTWPAEWIAERNRKNVEYPLGVDLFLVDRRGHMAALPRTTQVEV